MSIATTFIPELARAVSRKDRQTFNDKASLGVRMIALLTLPAGVALFVLRRPLIGLLLQRGEFTEADAIAAARVLGRIRPRARGLLGVPVRAPRVLRPPGHPHPVRPQCRPVRDEHRVRRRCSSAVGRPRARRWRSRCLVPHRRGVGVAGPVVQGAAASRCATIFAASCAWPSPLPSAARRRGSSPTTSAATPGSRRRRPPARRRRRRPHRVRRRPRRAEGAGARRRAAPGPPLTANCEPRPRKQRSRLTLLPCRHER